MATIKDVAKKANVSISTASYALNNDPRVKKETKDRIINVAKELNYHPSGAARNLKRRKSNTIGVFIKGFGGPVFSEFLDGINDQLLEEGYHIIVSSGKSAERLLQERQIDGAIIYDTGIRSELIKQVASPKLPVIILDRSLKEEYVYETLIENEKLVQELTTHLIEQGYHEIGFFSGIETSYDNQKRYESFKNTLENHNIMHHQHYKGDFTKKKSYEIIKCKIKNNKPLPDAIFCANDETAIGVMDALKEYHVKIPEEVAVVGFDNIELAKYYQPSLTTIEINRREWGMNVSKMLVAIIKNFDVDVYKPKGKIIYRQSS
ncbi:LacI family DNA-binding transcriptional regulator [Haloplasma contractile]|uniref:Alanine racemase protein n=1 Tax=Haloplasma contractile SSD-17B TaxID=1033810 RepID=U2FPJ5_9MOLU|nr:LacI family DNA-binding transcriptional regulator [Haloplasma contractile]ERJ12989.1 alanine racemase protein [Haloplasma contractile SSD-17B]